jgi:hypothetical protein
MPVASDVKTSAGTRNGGMIRDAGRYSARNSSKGALIDEAGRVFAAISERLPLEEVRERCLRGTLLSQRSSQNRERIWALVHQRYLVPGAGWLTTLIAQKTVLGVHDPEFTSLLYLLYALRDRLTYDFVTSALWLKGHRRRPVVSRNDVLDLLTSAAPEQPQIDRWTESTRVKLAGSVLTALRDFGVLAGKQKKFLVQPPLPPSTATALLRLLIAEGCRGRHVVEDHSWRLFMRTEAEVARLLAELARDGTIGFEKTGTTVVLDTPTAWETEP